MREPPASGLLHAAVRGVHRVAERAGWRAREIDPAFAWLPARFSMASIRQTAQQGYSFT